MPTNPSGWPIQDRATWTQTTNPDGSKTMISWAREAVTVGGTDARRQLLLAIDDIRPTRAYRSRGTTVEAAGTRALARPRIQAVHPWTLRIYYLSEGGQRCYADFSGLTEDNARDLARSYGRVVEGLHGQRLQNGATGALDAEAWSIKRPKTTCRACVENGRLLPPKKRIGCQACLGSGKVDVPPPEAKHGYHKVVFPSERQEPTEILE